MAQSAYERMFPYVDLIGDEHVSRLVKFPLPESVSLYGCEGLSWRNCEPYLLEHYVALKHKKENRKVVVHLGTNDLFLPGATELLPFDYVKQVVQDGMCFVLSCLDDLETVNIYFSSPLRRYDSICEAADFEEVYNLINATMTKFCEVRGVNFIDNSELLPVVYDPLLMKNHHRVHLSILGAARLFRAFCLSTGAPFSDHLFSPSSVNLLRYQFADLDESTLMKALFDSRDTMLPHIGRMAFAGSGGRFLNRLMKLTCREAVKKEIAKFIAWKDTVRRNTVYNCKLCPVCMENQLKNSSFPSNFIFPMERGNFAEIDSSNHFLSRVHSTHLMMGERFTILDRSPEARWNLTKVMFRYRNDWGIPREGYDIEEYSLHMTHEICFVKAWRVGWKLLDDTHLQIFTDRRKTMQKVVVINYSLDETMSEANSVAYLNMCICIDLKPFSAEPEPRRRLWRCALPHTRYMINYQLSENGAFNRLFGAFRKRESRTNSLVELITLPFQYSKPGAHSILLECVLLLPFVPEYRSQYSLEPIYTSHQCLLPVRVIVQPKMMAHALAKVETVLSTRSQQLREDYGYYGHYSLKDNPLKKKADGNASFGCSEEGDEDNAALGATWPLFGDKKLSVPMWCDDYARKALLVDHVPTAHIAPLCVSQSPCDWEELRDEAGTLLKVARRVPTCLTQVPLQITPQSFLKWLVQCAALDFSVQQQGKPIGGVYRVHVFSGRRGNSLRNEPNQAGIRIEFSEEGDAVSGLEVDEFLMFHCHNANRQPIAPVTAIELGGRAVICELNLEQAKILGEGDNVTVCRLGNYKIARQYLVTLKFLLTSDCPEKFDPSVKLSAKQKRSILRWRSANDMWGRLKHIALDLFGSGTFQGYSAGSKIAERAPVAAVKTKCHAETPHACTCNENSERAVLRVLEHITAKGEVSIMAVQGPAGCGKTYTVSRTIDQLVTLWKNNEQEAELNKIIMCAETNSAVDEMVRAVYALNEAIYDAELLYYVSREYMDSGQNVHHLASIMPTTNEEQSGVASIANSVDSCSVIAGTRDLLSKLFDRLPPNRLAVKVLFLDEASKITAFHGLMMAVRAQKTVIVGDSMQGDPYLSPEYQVLQNYRLNLSLLTLVETAYQQRGIFEDNVVRLITCYRFGNQMARIASSLVYNDPEIGHCIVSGVDELRNDQKQRMGKHRHGSFIISALPGGTSICCIPVTGEEIQVKDSASWANLSEAAVVFQLITRFQAMHDHDNSQPCVSNALQEGKCPSVLVLSMYTAQELLITAACTEHFGGSLPSWLRIETVYRSQGRTSNFVILSMVESHFDDNEANRPARDSLAQNRKLLNVATTRQQLGLFIVLSPARYWHYDGPVRSFLASAKDSLYINRSDVLSADWATSHAWLVQLMKNTGKEESSYMTETQQAALNEIGLNISSVRATYIAKP